MKKYMFFLLLVGLTSLQAQVQFETKLSKTSVALNERLKVDFVMNVNGDNFVPPSFDGFKVVAGPSQQISQSWVNGKSSFNKIYTYYLLPNQRGNLTIRQASMEHEGQVYKTTPVTVNVTAAVEQPRDPNDTTISVSDALHLVAEVSKSTPYINEPITVVYKLYFSYNIGISNWRELDKPKYNNFWSQNIDIKQLVAEEGTYNGEKFRYVVLRKTVLYPQKSGSLEIEPLSLDIDVDLPTNRRDLFGRPIMTKDHKRVSAGSRTIQVKALPENGKPIDFSGAVGKFDFKVTPTRTSLKQGESLDLEVSVSGNGNLKLFNLPKPVVPSALEMYDPVKNEQVNTPLSGMTGKISDTYTIIPQYKG
ncbi:MAG: BatD family protein, partial [Flavobacterium sp.]